MRQRVRHKRRPRTSRIPARSRSAVPRVLHLGMMRHRRVALSLALALLRGETVHVHPSAATPVAHTRRHHRSPTHLLLLLRPTATKELLLPRREPSTPRSLLHRRRPCTLVSSAPVPIRVALALATASEPTVVLSPSAVTTTTSAISATLHHYRLRPSRWHRRPAYHLPRLQRGRDAEWKSALHELAAIGERYGHLLHVRRHLGVECRHLSVREARGALHGAVGSEVLHPWVEAGRAVGSGIGGVVLLVSL